MSEISIGGPEVDEAVDQIAGILYLARGSVFPVLDRVEGPGFLRLMSDAAPKWTGEGPELEFFRLGRFQKVGRLLVPYTRLGL